MWHRILLSSISQMPLTISRQSDPRSTPPSVDLLAIFRRLECDRAAPVLEGEWRGFQVHQLDESDRFQLPSRADYERKYQQQFLHGNDSLKRFDEEVLLLSKRQFRREHSESLTRSEAGCCASAPVCKDLSGDSK